MPIKWDIKGKAMKARGIMDQISAAYDGFIEDGAEHLADVKALHSQVGEMTDDLQAAANVMGNSGGASDEQPAPVVSQTVPPAVIQPEPPATAPPPAPDAPAAVVDHMPQTHGMPVSSSNWAPPKQ